VFSVKPKNLWRFFGLYKVIQLGGLRRRLRPLIRPHVLDGRRRNEEYGLRTRENEVVVRKAHLSDERAVRVSVRSSRGLGTCSYAFIPRTVAGRSASHVRLHLEVVILSAVTRLVVFTALHTRRRRRRLPKIQTSLRCGLNGLNNTEAYTIYPFRNVPTTLKKTPPPLSF